MFVPKCASLFFCKGDDLRHKTSSPCPHCPVFAFGTWSKAIRQGDCHSVRLTAKGHSNAEITCRVVDGQKARSKLFLLQKTCERLELYRKICYVKEIERASKALNRGVFGSSGFPVPCGHFWDRPAATGALRNDHSWGQQPQWHVTTNQDARLESANLISGHQRWNLDAVQLKLGNQSEWMLLVYLLSRSLKSDVVVLSIAASSANALIGIEWYRNNEINRKQMKTDENRWKQMKTDETPDQVTDYKMLYCHAKEIGKSSSASGFF